MYAVINTMNAVPGDSIGTIASRHKTLDAAQRAEASLQRATKRANGQASYLRVVKLRRLWTRHAFASVGNHVHPEDVYDPH
jgi:hypothetical protein